MTTAHEVVTRWGDTLLDTAIVDGDYAIGDTVIVRAGALIAEPSGCVGQIAYTVATVSRPARTLHYAHGDGRRMLPYLAVVLAAHLGVWVGATSADRELDRLPIEVVARPSHTTRAFAHADHVPPKGFSTDVTHDDAARGQGIAMAGAAGAAGADKAIEKRGHVAVKNIGEEAQLAKADLLEQVRHAGILGHAPTITESYQALLGPDHLTSAFDGASVTGPLDGGEGAAHGNFGLAYSGLGVSGGGSGWGTIGTGTSGRFSGGTTFNHGWGGRTPPPSPTWNGSSWQGGDYAIIPNHHLGGHGPELLALCPADYRERCAVIGELDPAVVRRYVRRRISALTYCFEKELLANPALPAGPVLADFEIGSDGKVAQVTATGVGDKVDGCVTGVLEQVELPRAAGPTHVTYALVYRRPT